MDSRRKLKRIDLISYLEVFDRNVDELVGYAVDISTDGIGMRTRAEHVVGENYELRVELPAELAGQSNIHVNARCAWCVVSDNPDVWLTGFEFVLVPPECAEAIEVLIERYQRR